MRSKVTCALLLVGYSVFAQSYEPMLRDDVIWQTRRAFYYISEPQGYSDNHYWLDSSHDTMVNGLQYSGFSGISVRLREDLDSGKVYALKEDGTERLWLDFSLNVGDSVVSHLPLTEDSSMLVVDQVDSILVDANYRKTLRLENQSAAMYWIEGVGNAVGLYETYDSPSGYLIIDNLICYRYKSDTSFTPLYSSVPYNGCTPPTGIRNHIESEKLYLYPNPAMDVVNLHGISSNERFDVLDHLGRIVLSDRVSSQISLQSLGPGFYIIRLLERNRNLKFQVIR